MDDLEEITARLLQAIVHQSATRRNGRGVSRPVAERLKRLLVTIRATSQVDSRALGYLKQCLDAMECLTIHCSDNNWSDEELVVFLKGVWGIIGLISDNDNDMVLTELGSVASWISFCLKIIDSSTYRPSTVNQALQSVIQLLDLCRRSNSVDIEHIVPGISSAMVSFANRSSARQSKSNLSMTYSILRRMIYTVACDSELNEPLSKLLRALDMSGDELSDEEDRPLIFNLLPNADKFNCIQVHPKLAETVLSILGGRFVKPSYVDVYFNQLMIVTSCITSKRLCHMLERATVSLPESVRSEPTRHLSMILVCLRLLAERQQQVNGAALSYRMLDEVVDVFLNMDRFSPAKDDPDPEIQTDQCSADSLTRFRQVDLISSCMILLRKVHSFERVVMTIVNSLNDRVKHIQALRLLTSIASSIHELPDVYNHVLEAACSILKTMLSIYPSERCQTLDNFRQTSAVLSLKLLHVLCHHADLETWLKCLVLALAGTLDRSDFVQSAARQLESSVPENLQLSNKRDLPAYVMNNAVFEFKSSERRSWYVMAVRALLESESSDAVFEPLMCLLCDQAMMQLLSAGDMKVPRRFSAELNKLILQSSVNLAALLTATPSLESSTRDPDLSSAVVKVCELARLSVFSGANLDTVSIAEQCLVNCLTILDADDELLLPQIYVCWKFMKSSSMICSPTLKALLRCMCSLRPLFIRDRLRKDLEVQADADVFKLALALHVTVYLLLSYDQVRVLLQKALHVLATPNHYLMMTIGKCRKHSDNLTYLRESIQLLASIDRYRPLVWYTVNTMVLGSSYSKSPDSSNSFDVKFEKTVQGPVARDMESFLQSVLEKATE